MKNSPTSIQPSAAHRLFVRQSVQSIEIQRDEAVVNMKDSNVRVVLSTATIVSSKSLGFTTLQLQTAQGTFTLSGLPTAAIQSIETAIGEAKRRAALVDRLASEYGKIEASRRSWNAIASQKSYMTATQVDKWLADANLITTLSEEDADLITKLPEGEQKKRKALDLLRTDSRRAADRHNTEFVEELLDTQSVFFDTCESYPLTDPQREAIVHDEDNALVIAGAGTGKTTTVVGKVGFIVNQGWAKPEEILMLAFTRKTADEMTARIRAKLGLNISSRTFDSLGRGIIAEVSGKQAGTYPEAEDISLKTSTIKNIVSSLIKEPDFRHGFLDFQSMLRRPYKPEWEFNTLAEYSKHLAGSDLKTLKGHFVRSYEECEIANWLFVNGINYSYDQPYEIKVDTPEHRPYKPGFHVPAHGVYIEHFAINRAEETASYINKAKYLEGMMWRRNTHKTNNTKLVETFAYERQEGVLLQSLEAKLRDYGVVLRPISPDETAAALNKAGRIEAFVSVVGTFISLLKSSGKSIEEVTERASSIGYQHRSNVFLNLFRGIFKAYENQIHQGGEMDFDDMLAVATNQVNSGRFQSPYRYIVIDDFQDISRGRANLVLALRNQKSGCKIFAAGDDWQSIYRYMGSDISLTTDFAGCFGFTRTTALDTTFRFYDRIADFGSRFVQANPGQIRKTLTTPSSSDVPGVTIWSCRADSYPLTQILEDINQINPSASVFVLARYADALPDDIHIIRSRFRRMNIDLHTIHAAKGLEADYVIVVGLDQNKRGFPSKVADDPVLALVLPNADSYEFAEERRFFYVALTRARKRVHVISDIARPSAFVQEVLADSNYAKVLRGDRAN